MVSAGFVHLLGQAIVELPVLGDRSFPWAPFLCAVGFLATLLADQFAEALSHRDENLHAALSHGHDSLHHAPRQVLGGENSVLQHVAIADFEGELSPVLLRLTVQ